MTEMDSSNIEVASGAIVPSKCGELAFRVIKKVSGQWDKIWDSEIWLI